MSPTTPGTRVCVCPGSFDPPTFGHLDIIRRCVTLFDQVIVAVVHNPAKPGWLTPDQRAEILTGCLQDQPGVRVETVPGGLLARYCERVGAGIVAKGLRSSLDFEYERAMAQMNRSLTNLETVYLDADPKWAHLSSSLVREVANLGADVTTMVPTQALPVIQKRLIEQA